MFTFSDLLSTAALAVALTNAAWLVMIGLVMKRHGYFR
jgi:hypothetical protein